jgi:1-acyl-sn-glycerol-3-phosphate acyltransferase
MSLAGVLCAFRKMSRTVVGSAAAYGLLTPIWISKWCGRIAVCGTIPSKQAVPSGGILFIANHPSLIETIALPALLSPWRWGKADTKLPYSVADSRLFGSQGQWLYEHFRCIAVHRHEHSSAGRNWRTARTCLHILTIHGTLIVYPEGGRTCKGNEWTHREQRMVRACNPTIVKLAKRANATIIPVWISHGDCTKPQSMLQGYCKLFFQKKMVVTFGAPVTFSSPEISGLEVANALLHTTPATKT